jgi:hypothetical protein
MPVQSLSALPDSARLWVFAAERDLTPPERAAVLGDVDAFLSAWAAHGVPLTSARDLRHDRFLIVAVDEAAAGVSGCSIDALTRKLREHERRLGIALLDNGPVLYRDGDRIARVSRARFRELAAAGAVSRDTVVFDNTVPSLGALRAGRWETPARASWHGRAFFDDAGRV